MKCSFLVFKHVFIILTSVSALNVYGSTILHPIDVKHLYIYFSFHFVFVTTVKGILLGLISDTEIHCCRSDPSSSKVTQCRHVIHHQ